MQRRAVVLSAFASATALLAGCANRYPRYPRSANLEFDRYSTAALLLLQPQRSERSTSVFPPAGEVATAQVGSSMASAREFGVREAVQVDGAPTVAWKDRHDDGSEGDAYRVLMSPGNFTVDFTDSHGSRFFGEQPTVLQTYEKGKLDDIDAIKAMYKLTREGQLWVLYRWPDDTEIELREVDDVTCTVKKQRTDENGTEFRRELLYTGRAGNQITLMYREFKGDMARPAFTQQLQYEASSNAIIGYQGARFRIISATNTEVTYEVQSPMSPY